MTIMAATIPIAHLEQASHDTGDSTILGVVTLLWPYSSSTRRAAILLAEPDFRLRKSKGQVRIQFAGAAAEAIAQSRISSGDEVRLSLRGARRVDAAAGIVSTPGRSVDIELVFKRQLVCEVSLNRIHPMRYVLTERAADNSRWPSSDQPRHTGRLSISSS